MTETTQTKPKHALRRPERPYKACTRFSRGVGLFTLILALTACSGGTTSSGGGQERMAGLTQEDREAFAMTGGFQGKWLKGSRAIERRDIPVGGAYPNGLIVLGNDTLGESVGWIAGVIVHEAKHIQDGRPCSLEGERRAIQRQIEFDLTIGGAHVEWLESQIGKHDCQG